MKKLLLIALLMLALVITAVACTETPDEPGTSAEDVTTAETPTTEAPDTDEPETPAPDTNEPETPAPDTKEPETDEPAPETEPTVILDKTEYLPGESIMISATGSDKDWVGIAVAGGSESIRWWYVADAGEGVAIDALNDSHIQAGTGAATGALPVGEYEVVWVANDQSLNGADKAFRYKFTIKDPSAPVLMLKPEDLNTLAGAAAPNVNQLGSTEVITEGSNTFVRWTAAGGDPYVAIIPLGSSYTLPQYMAIRYRTNSATEGQFFVGSGAGWTGSGDSFMVTWVEGDWNFVIVDLTQTGVTSITDGLITYARMDFFAGDSAEGDYFDVAYVGVFNAAEDAQKYEFELTKAPHWTEAPDQVKHQSFDQLYAGTGNADNGPENIFTPGASADWDFVVDYSDIAYADFTVDTLTYWGWIGFMGEKGQFGYQIDMNAAVYNDEFAFVGGDHEGIINAAKGAGADSGHRMKIAISIAGLEGEHTVRAMYKTADGMEICLNEFTVKLPARPTHYDNYNVPQDQWVMTGHNTNLNDASNGMVAAGGVESAALLHQGSIALGEIDLSKYSKVVVMWGCDNSDVTIGRYNENANNRIMLLNAVMDGVMSPAEETIIAGGTYELKGWAVTAFEIDLTDVNYNGPVWLAIDALPGTFALFASVEFIGGEIDYSHQHSYETAVTAPTCTEAGFTTYTCACGDTYVADEVAALGHDMVTDAAVDATCTEAGLTAGEHCSRCDHKVAQEEVPAKGHAYDQGTCTVCGATDPDYVAPEEPTEDKWQVVTELQNGAHVLIGAPAHGKLLSATKTGFYNIGVDYSADNFTNVTNAEIFVVTVNGDGTYTFTSLTGDVIALADSYSSLNADGANKTWTLEAKGDGIFYVKNVGRGNYLEWYDSKNNWSTYYNANSDLFEISFYAQGASDTPDVPHEHSYETAVTAPTCTEEGYTTYTCACGDTYVDNKVDALGHTFVDGTCACGAADPNYEAHVHSYEAVVTAPTCTATGYTTYTCACGDTYTADETAMVPHVDANLDITCDFEGCTKRLIPAADSEISLFTASHMIIVSLPGNYYMEGTVTQVLDAKNGNFVITDEAGDSVTVRLPKNAEGVTHANWEQKIVVGDVVRLYGQPKRDTNSNPPCAAMVQSAVLTILESHDHVFGEATCLDNGVCFCGKVGIPALGHTDEDASGLCDRCDWNMNLKVETVVTRTDDGSAVVNDAKTTSTWNGTEFSVTVDKSTGTMLYTTSKDHMRFYKQNELVIASLNGKAMNTVTITFTAASHMTNFEKLLTGFTFTKDEGKFTITIEHNSAEDLLIKNSGTSTIQFKAFDIVYE